MSIATQQLRNEPNHDGEFDVAHFQVYGADGVMRSINAPGGESVQISHLFRKSKPGVGQRAGIIRLSHDFVPSISAIGVIVRKRRHATSPLYQLWVTQGSTEYECEHDHGSRSTTLPARNECILDTKKALGGYLSCNQDAKMVVCAKPIALGLYPGFRVLETKEADPAVTAVIEELTRKTYPRRGGPQKRYIEGDSPPVPCFPLRDASGGSKSGGEDDTRPLKFANIRSVCVVCGVPTGDETSQLCGKT